MKDLKGASRNAAMEGVKRRTEAHSKEKNLTKSMGGIKGKSSITEATPVLPGGELSEGVHHGPSNKKSKRKRKVKRQ